MDTSDLSSSIINTDTTHSTPSQDDEERTIISVQVIEEHLKSLLWYSKETVYYSRKIVNSWKQTLFRDNKHSENSCLVDKNACDYLFNIADITTPLHSDFFMICQNTMNFTLPILNL